MSEYRVINPATGEKGVTSRVTSADEISGLIRAADLASRSWRELPITQRAQVLRDVAQLFRERCEMLADLIVAEIGRPRRAARREPDVAARIFDYYADHADELLEDRPLHSPRGPARVKLEPVGAVLGIMPWNYPYYQVARFAAPNLLLGNAVLLKHAPNCPDSAAAIYDIIAATAAPRGLYTALYTSNEVTAQVIAHPFVRGVSLTGSERAGRAVAELAGRHLKKCVLELGGSDALIVLDAASVGGAVVDGMTARMSNSGQTCTAPKRMIVVDAAYDDFVAAAAEAARNTVTGDPRSENTDMGPLSSESAAAEVAAQIDDALAQGAQLVAGGHREGTWVEPTVLTGIGPGMRVWAEEIFGPVLSVIRFRDLEEAFRINNEVRYGLSSALYTRDNNAAFRAMVELDNGITYVNAPTIGAEAHLPFGGVKQTGNGHREGGWEVYEFYSETKVCYIDYSGRLQRAQIDNYAAGPY